MPAAVLPLSELDDLQRWHELDHPEICTGKGVGISMDRDGGPSGDLRQRVRDVLSRYREAGGLPDADLVELVGELDLLAAQTDHQSEDLRRIQRELAFNRGVIRCSTSAIATCDLEGEMTYGNPFFQEKWGFGGPDEFLGRPFWKYWSVQE